MARIRIILEDEEGSKLAGTRPRIYELGKCWIVCTRLKGHWSDSDEKYCQN
jgi:hypothetical protein